MSAATAPNPTGPHSSGLRNHLRVADVGTVAIVRPDERLRVLLVGGSLELAKNASKLFGGSGRHPIELVHSSRSPEALEEIRSGQCSAVIVSDDLVGRSVQYGIAERKLNVPVIRMIENNSRNRAHTRVQARLDGALACVFADELTTAVLEVAVLGVVELHRAFASGARAVRKQPKKPSVFLSEAAFLSRVAAAMERAKSDPAFRYSLLFVDTNCFGGPGKIEADAALEMRDQLERRLDGLAKSWPATAVQGDGYAVLLQGFDHGEDLLQAEHFRRELQSSYSTQRGQMYLDLGFGLARGRGFDTSAQGALDRARRSVHVPKAPVNDAAAFSGERPVVSPPEPSSLEVQLADALKYKQFSLTYQPIVELESERGVGFEALIRWKHPDGEERPAAEFMMAANDSRLIVPIGYWSAEAAIRQMAEWHRDFELDESTLISINLSTPQVLDSLFVERVRSLLMTTGLAPASVRFEIEASTIAEHPSVARRLVDGLVAAGAKVWVEDYGLSECTVDHLRGFPLDGLKIDRRFVSRIDGTDKTSGRIRHIVTAARALGVRTLGEGIENALQANVLRWLGCSLGQGHHFAKPLAVGDAFAFLAGRR